MKTSAMMDLDIDSLAKLHVADIQVTSGQLSTRGLLTSGLKYKLVKFFEKLSKMNGK